MNALKNLISYILGSAALVFYIAVYALIAVGDIYWLWMAIQIGSFLMFFIGLFPPTAMLVAMPVGAWSLLFGAPDWVINFFG